MIKPEELRTATEKALSGLTADESLKQKILLKASESEQKEHEPVYRPVLKLCAIVGVLLLMVAGLNSIRPLSPSAPGEMTVFAAGGKDSSGTSIFAQIDTADITGIKIGNNEMITDSLYGDLIRILQSEAKESETEVPAETGLLTLYMKDGTEKVFEISDPYLYKDGKCWICSGFFSRLQDINP